KGYRRSTAWPAVGNAGAGAHPFLLDGPLYCHPVNIDLAGRICNPNGRLCYRSRLTVRSLASLEPGRAAADGSTLSSEVWVQSVWSSFNVWNRRNFLAQCTNSRRAAAHRYTQSVSQGTRWAAPLDVS